MLSKRLMVVPLTLAMLMGAAQAQQRQFNDVPAGHWARQAVEFAVQCGLVEGFPDGTFRGNSNLTRYQIALIFFRLFQSQQSGNLSPECRLVGQVAQSAVGPELQALQQRFEQLEAASRDRDTRLNALEAEVRTAAQAAQQVQALSQRLDQLESRLQQMGAQPTPPAQTPTDGPTAAELQNRIAALEQQVRTLSSAPAPDTSALERRIAALEGRPPAAAPDLSTIETRIAALEQQVRQQTTAPAPNTADLERRLAALESRPQAAAPDTSALERRIAALEGRPQGAAPDTSGLEQRIAALEQQSRTQPAAAESARVAALEEQVRTLNTQVTELRATATQPQAPAQPTPELRPTVPATPTPERRVSNFYLGAGVGLANVLASGNLGDQFNAGGFLGVRNLLLGFGLRAGANYTLTGGALAAQAFVTRDLNPGGFNPYAGLGATITLTGPTEVYGTALLGLDLINLGPLAIFAEVTPQFLGNGFGIGTKAGLKLNF